MSTESVVASKVEKYLVSMGWKVQREFKIRGRTADIVAVKGKEIGVVEVKGGSGDIQLGIEYALHQKNAANFSYLAMPEERATDKVIDTCRNLGIGVMLINGGVREVVKPARSNALLSVQRLVFGERWKKQGPVVTARSALGKLFRSRGLILILKLLFLNSASEFHLNDIARRTGLAPSTAAKESSVLLNLGLVTKRTKGNLVLYSINKGGIIYDELKRIFMKYELLDEIIASKLPAAGNIRYALIYGSFAKGTEREGSDVDLLIVGDVDEEALLKSISEAQGRIGREINYILWSEKEFLDKVRKRIPLLNDISKTPVIMMIGDENEFKRTIIQKASREVPV